MRPFKQDPFDRAPWMRRAACHGKDRELWFPPRGTDVSVPKAICAECPVRADCLEYGLTERHGIWGGTTDNERRDIRRERRRSA